MKKLQIVAWAIALCTLSAACQSTSAQKSPLSNAQTRSEIMEAIAKDSVMSKEMIGMMMNNKNGMMMMQQHQMIMMQNQGSMMNMLKANPDMMSTMMGDMMSMCNKDSSMCRLMMGMMQSQPNVMESMKGMCDMGNMKMEPKKDQQMQHH